MSTGLLAVSYFVHLIATVVWLGGLAVFGLVSIPAWREQIVAQNGWLLLQQRLAPWINLSMAVLWVSGFVQMTGDEHYSGFLSFDSSWAVAILLKHVGVVVMTVVALYAQFSLYPALRRLADLRGRAVSEQQARLQAQERVLLRVNLFSGVTVLIFTAIATAL